MTEENEVLRNKTTKFYTSEHGRDGSGILVFNI